MSIWSKISRSKGKVSDKGKYGDICGDVDPIEVFPDSACRYAFLDVEVGLKDHQVHDIGAIRYDGAIYHDVSKRGLLDFLRGTEYLCGHNVVHHDVHYLFGDVLPMETGKIDRRDRESFKQVEAGANHGYGSDFHSDFHSGFHWNLVDTLYLSPLLFPEHPYHKLVKDDKLICDQVNNPVNDCEKARDLLFDEIARWKSLPEDKQCIFATLLWNFCEFNGFLRMVGARRVEYGLVRLIRRTYRGKICENVDLQTLIEYDSPELAYALALVDTSDHHSITPSWVLHTYPKVERVIRILRHQPCKEGCDYCRTKLDVFWNLNAFFGYDKFRTYAGEPLQEKAVKAAVLRKSLLAIFPTGGGKSLTFQLPALMEGRSVRGLTVVISPLQSLMKDQVDNLAERGITEAVTINGLLDPLERAQAIERVMNGDAALLYLAPESLRSRTLERILLSRHVVRFVIDEAHCFSAWGQDFRVDYLYIGKFIREYQKKKGCTEPIPISCFTATAKQKVIQDICDYFRETLDLELELYASDADRTNLQYTVLHTDSDDQKYIKLRDLIADSNCPTIVYVSRTRRAEMLAMKLSKDGYKALPFYGKMESDRKVENQEAFMKDRVRIIVATSAFGMGVDKKDVGLVIHYDISDSLENYVQEAGRAGRDPQLQARCYVLYGDDDLDKHFLLLNQTKLSISEIQQVWKAIKELTKNRNRVSCSALEIARQAGWDDVGSDMETKVRTALSALERSGYIERGNNIPHVYATGITVKNMEEARQRITSSTLFSSDDAEKAVRVIKSLITQKYITRAPDADAESRIDYLADMLGISKWEVVSVVEKMRQDGILADSRDMSAYLQDAGDSERKSKILLDRFITLEKFLLGLISEETLVTSYKQLNDKAFSNGIETSTEKDVRTLVYFLAVMGYIKKESLSDRNLEIKGASDKDSVQRRFEKRCEICHFAIGWLYQQVERLSDEPSGKGSESVQFSIVELFNRFKEQNLSLFNDKDLQLKDVEEALLYLNKIKALKLDGGFLVLYNAMDICRIKENRARYKLDDYRMLDEFYKQKMQQIHIVGEYANLMVKDYGAAIRFVRDYFHMDYRKFLSKYFKGERADDIQRNLTPKKYRQLFGQLSECQREIISDKESRCIVVAAGPGSGKTRVLVHKLASLLLLEDVKHEQLLMLTFSRAAATEFKQRLMELVGNAAHYVEIKTFHSYCFDLLGRVGNLDDVKGVVARAAAMIGQGEVEPSRIGKSVLVIDEAQDMGADEFALVKALMANNEDMRVIAVGDDDQNIFHFRGSDSKYLNQLSKVPGCRVFEMTENYRSARKVVDFANDFVLGISKRMKNMPIRSMRDDDGWVEITKYHSGCMYQPLVRSLMDNQTKGSICVLTQTNEEAVTMAASLLRNGIKARLIQSMDGLRFWNLAEVRYFLKCIERSISTPVITDEVWSEAQRALVATYERSTALEYVRRSIDRFGQVNKVRYINDLKEFFFESLIEDFCDIKGEDVVVSTIHKAKGLEFDDVYLLVSGAFTPSDELLRKLYVGITRARKRLFIHTGSSYFNISMADRFKVDDRSYGEPDEIVLQLSHKDVILDFFKSRKHLILNLRGGDPLGYHDRFLFNSEGTPVAKFSDKMQKEMQEWQERGYGFKSASVRFVVAWKSPDAPKEEPETAVLLADLVLTH